MLLLPVKVEEDRQHGLVDVAVTDAFIEQEAGVSHHRLQGVLPHDIVKLIGVQVLEDQLVPQLTEVADRGASQVAVGRACPLLHGIAPIGQVQTAAAAVKADG